MRELAFGIIIVVLLVSLIVLFCAILIKLYISKITKYNKVLYEKEIEHQKQINQSIIETQEQVLQNISQELHDDAGQQLTYINFRIENLKLDSEELNEKLEPVSDAVSQLSLSIRNLSHSLNNHILSQQDLLKAIETETRRINQLNKIKVHFQVSKNQSTNLSTNEKIVIYRIFQELINNSLKHSEAENIQVEINVSPYFRMVISDDGKGFDADIINSFTTNGLLNIQTRADSIGYNINLESSKGNGAKFTLSEKKEKA